MQKSLQKIVLLQDASQTISVSQMLVQGYSFALCDSSVSFPFQLTPELLHRTSILAKVPINERGRAIFNYLSQKLEYGTSRRDFGKNYSLSAEVWANKQGVCGEMSYLYVSMARFAGLISGYARVSIDTYGEKVCHACAYFQTNKNSPVVCADIAYRQYDIKHLKWIAINDEKAWELFRQWRTK